MRIFSKSKSARLPNSAVTVSEFHRLFVRDLLSSWVPADRMVRHFERTEACFSQAEIAVMRPLMPEVRTQPTLDWLIDYALQHQVIDQAEAKRFRVRQAISREMR